MILKKFVSLILTLIFTGVVFTSTARAGEVDRVLATADSAAVMAAINEIGTPLSDADAREMRGELFPVAIIIAAVGWELVKSYAIRFGVSSTALWIARMNPYGAEASIVRSIEIAIKAHFGW